MHLSNSSPSKNLLFGAAAVALLAVSTGANARGAKSVDDIAVQLIEHVQTGEEKLFDKVFDRKAYLARVQAAGGGDTPIGKEIAKGAKNWLKFMGGPKVTGYEGGHLGVVQAVMNGDEGRIVLREDIEGAPRPRYVEFLLHADRKGRPRVIDWIRLGEATLEARHFVVRDGFIERNYPQIIAGIGLTAEPGDVEAMDAAFAPGERSYEDRLAKFRALPERYQQNKTLLMWWLIFHGNESDAVREQILKDLVTHHGDDVEVAFQSLEYYARTRQWSHYDEVIERLIDRWGEDEWLVAERDAEAPTE